MDAKNVMNGTYGILRIDGIEYANISSFEAKITNTRQDLQLAGSVGVDSKLLASVGSGTMTFRKINSRVIARNLPAIIAGKDFKMLLILTVDDPDGLGKETISIADVWTNEFDLFKFEAGATMEENVTFGFNQSKIIPVDLVVE